jgi:hypothetical protein
MRTPHRLHQGARALTSGMDDLKKSVVTDFKEMQSKATEAVATAIAQHLHATAALMAAKAASNGGESINTAEIMARLDLILTKLEPPIVPLSDQLWGTAQIGSYLRRSTDNVQGNRVPVELSVPDTPAGAWQSPGALQGP